MSDKAKTQDELDEEEGFRAFPSGRWMDAQRGKGSFPNRVRCPYTKPERVTAWNRGYNRAHRLMNED